MPLPDWLLLLAVLLAASVLLGLVARRLHLPLSVMLALTGFVAGALGRPYGLESPLRAETFEHAVAYLFLPVLIFEAALGLEVRSFFRNLAGILVLALPALLLSTALAAAALHWALALPWLLALIFGVMTSATDPVAVVAVFRKLGVPERLLVLIEGESLLNDGVAIVLFTVLLGVVAGDALSPAGTVGEFLRVFFGGLGAGAVLGLAAALLLPWLEALPAAALSLALAYGGFVGAEYLAGMSGVTTTLAAGLTLKAFLPSQAAPAPRETLHRLWGSLGYIANALLFLFIGLAIEYTLILQYWQVILLTLVVVLLARALPVLLSLFLIERIAHLPRLGLRNQAVLIWGGLRGAVALALALSLPQELPLRELLVALTGGVVLGTLLINATTIGLLVRFLGLDRPDRTQRFLAAGARLTGVRAARERLAELELQAPTVQEALSEAERQSLTELKAVHLTPAEELMVVTQRGLHVERDTYQRLSDAGLIPPVVARTLLHEIDDLIENASASGAATREQRHRPRFDRLLERLLARMPPPTGLTPTQIAYAEASARRLAARRAGAALEEFAELPNLRAETLDCARARFASWQQEAEHELAEFDAQAVSDWTTLYRQQAEVLSRAAAQDELRRLVGIGLLPERVAERAASGLGEEVES